MALVICNVTSACSCLGRLVGVQRKIAKKGE